VKAASQPEAEKRKPPSEPVKATTRNPAFVYCEFTQREFDTLRTVCRDSDNELGLRALVAGFERAK
jgi:hypothetical protein